MADGQGGTDTGFVVSDRGRAQDYWEARNRNAHAWVEAYDDLAQQWITVEPTPGMRRNKGRRGGRGDRQRKIQNEKQTASEFKLDPRSAALVTPDQAKLLGPWRPDDRVGERQIRFLTDRPGEVELQIGPGPGGYLVLADTSLPGWTVEVDGTPAPLARGDLFLRVVPIQVENACRVRFTYTTPGLPGGLTITVISVGLLIGLVLYLAVSRRPSPSVEKPI